MSALLPTLIFAFIVVLLAILGLGISWLLTGKSRLQPGACGRAPHKKKDSQEGCGTSASCSLCEKPSVYKDIKKDR